MKTWIVSSLDEETIQAEETIQGRKLYEEIRYMWGECDIILSTALSLSLGEFFCIALGSICYLSCLDSFYQTYVIITKIKGHFKNWNFCLNSCLDSCLSYTSKKIERRDAYHFK
jgi:hypothetical protein